MEEDEGVEDSDLIGGEEQLLLLLSSFLDFFDGGGWGEVDGLVDFFFTGLMSDSWAELVSIGHIDVILDWESDLLLDEEYKSKTWWQISAKLKNNKNIFYLSSFLVYFIEVTAKQHSL